MDITDIVSTEYVEFSPEQQVSKLAGAFEDQTLQGVVVVEDGSVRGVVTRRQLASSHYQPNQKIKTLVWSVPRVSPTEDVRDVAQAMIDSNSHLLPVVEGPHLEGVVTADGILRAVQPNLSEATVGQAYSDDLVSVEPRASFGEAIHEMRERRISHLPVVEDDEAVGILSLHDIVDVTVRDSEQSQGGQGGDMTTGGQPHGGFGAREGERDRILDLPVRDVMVSPVRTIGTGATLETTVEEMFAIEGSSLVVVDDDERPLGILTKTDVLAALTWEAEGNRAVQVYGTEYLDDMSYEGVVDVIERFETKNGGTTIIDAKLHLHEHDEKQRGTPLLLARIRLHTDRGLFIASGEGYGASAAINEARDKLERRIRDAKTDGKSKKHPDEEYWERRFGWWLEA
jgi:CBS domain-containing protein/ribosome-associated translation inhibitor RaiA